MTKHEKLKQEKFEHAVEDLLYNSGGNVMWSLFKFNSGNVTIYYHDIEDFQIIKAIDTKGFSLAKIADYWDPASKKLYYNNM